MQVGESNLLDELFVESRFNAWGVGEVHILDQRIVPNGRRDHFEQNIQFRDLVSKLTPTAHELSRLCRSSSLRRNAIRQFDIAYEQAAANISVIKQGLVGTSEKKRLDKDTVKLLKRMEKCCAHSALEQHSQSKLRLKLKRLHGRIQKAAASQAKPKALKGLEPTEKKILEKLVSLIYECSPNKGAARQLIDRILAKI
jgi:molecular chaperone HtpG